MKVLLTLTSITKGGQERQFVEFLKGILQEKDKYEVEVVLFSKKITYQEFFNIGEFPMHYIERKPKQDPRGFYKFYRICQQFKPDIIHSWSIMTSIYAAPTVWLMGTKFVNFNVYDAPKDLNYFRGNYAKIRLTFPVSDVIVGNSIAGLNSYHTPDEKRRCVYNGFDLNRVKDLESKEAIRAQYQIKTSKVVGMVGAFQDRKDYYTFIEAGQVLMERDNDVTIMCIGGGKNLDKCKSMVPEKYKDRFIFTGLINNVESVVNVFNVGVLSTNTDIHGEGIANVIIEYMILGKPVVATDGGGTPEIVRDGKTGFIVPPFSPEIMADKIKVLLDDPNLANEIGANGSELIKTEFNNPIMVHKFFKIYDELLQS